MKRVRTGNFNGLLWLQTHDCIESIQTICCYNSVQLELFLFCVLYSSSSRAVNSPLHPFACTQVTGWSWQLSLEMVQQRPVETGSVICGLYALNLRTFWQSCHGQGTGLDEFQWSLPPAFFKYFNKHFSTGAGKGSNFFISPASDISLCILLLHLLKTDPTWTQMKICRQTQHASPLEHAPSICHIQSQSKEWWPCKRYLQCLGFLKKA